MAKTASVESKPAIKAAIGDLVVINDDSFLSVWIVSAVSNDVPARLDVALIGPNRPNSALGRLVRNVSADQIAGLFKKVDV